MFRGTAGMARNFFNSDPLLVAMLVIVFYNMADMFFIGQTGETVQMPAVSAGRGRFLRY